MIGKLRGTVDSAGVESVVLDVGGVGYLVHCSPRTLSALPAPGEPASLLIDTHVREDMIRLYGFATEAEREWFRLMQGVQGVGARLALAILGVLSTSALAQAVAGGDKTAVSRAPGVGPKLASRIVLELKAKGPGGAGAARGFGDVVCRFTLIHRAWPPALRFAARCSPRRLTIPFTRRPPPGARRLTLPGAGPSLAATIQGSTRCQTGASSYGKAASPPSTDGSPSPAPSRPR